MKMDTLATLPIMLPPMSSLTHVGRHLTKQDTDKELKTALFATMLRTAHVFDLHMTGGQQLSGLFNGVLSQLLAQDIVSSHQAGFGALAFNSTKKTGG